MSTSTAVVLAVAAWLGGLAGRQLATSLGEGWPTGPVLIGGLLTVVTVLIAAGVQERRRDRRLRWLPVGAVGILLVVLAGAAARTQVVIAGPLAGLAASRDGVAVAVGARLVSDPSIHDGRWWALARLEETALPDGDRITSGERVVLRGHGVPPSYASMAELTGLATPVEGEVAPWLRSLGVSVQVEVVEIASIRAPPAWVAATTAVRERLSQAAHARLPPAPASLLTGLVTGDTAGQPEALEDAVRTSGLSHLVAVSGSNVALVVAGVLGLVIGVGGGRRLAWWIALGTMWWFVVLVRAEPSVVRAALMASLVLAAMLIGHLRDPLHMLSVAVVLALLIDPLLVGRLGFALSVAATAGVLAIGPRIQRWLPGPLTMRRLLASTIGAQAAVAPLLLVGGLPVGLSALPANLVAVPAAGVASMLGAVAALVAVVDPGSAALLGWAARPALDIVVWSAETFAGPVGQWVDGLSTPVLVAALVGLMLIGARQVMGSRRVIGTRWVIGPRQVVGSRGWSPIRRALAALVAVGVAVAVTTLPMAGDPAHPTRELVVLDVGQGDAILLSDPTAGWMLVDGGPDPGRLRQALRRRGVRELAVVVITHPHADHHGGLDGIVDHLPVGLLVVGPPAGEPAVSPVVGEARTAGVMVQQVDAGDSWRFGSFEFRVLSPPPTGIDDDANESSLVLRLDTPHRSVLLTGDAEVLAQDRMLRTPDLLDVDVLKVPHHGGDTNAVGFLAATTPEVAVISAGEGNPFGHPHPAVLADLGGVVVRRTDQEGDVVVPLS